MPDNAAIDVLAQRCIDTRRHAGNWRDTFARKLRAAGWRLKSIIAAPWAFAVVVAMRLARPLVLLRLNPVFATRIGHFAANTELYLCERRAGVNVPVRRHVDISFLFGPPANRQLAEMWSRVLRLWPAWMFGEVHRMNRRIPGGTVHEVGHNTQFDRDVLNLLETSPVHLSFTADEERRGQQGLSDLGIPSGAPFVCIVARDGAFLRASGGPSFDYHAYRDVDIANYVEAAEALADRGCYVVRMGSVVAAPLPSSHPRVVDYATNGQRSDFMDVYLPARCLFCLSCGTGLDAVSLIFRRPIAYVNVVPIGYWFTFAPGTVGIFKRHRLAAEARELSLREIVDRGVAFTLRSDAFSSAGVELVENTPEEIRDLALEMLERLRGEWQPDPADEDLQRRFWTIYPTAAINDANGRPLHGAIRARYGATFLRESPEWLQ